jgi:glycosyltransferase involved in cell wall biosynthesis
VRGNDLDRQLFPPGDMARLEWCLRSASRVITVSHDLARKVRVLVNREAVVVPNAVDTSTFQPAAKPVQLAERYAIRPEELVLVFSGELRAKKGLRFLLEALRQVLVWQPARLLIIGEVRPKDRGEYTRTASIDPAVEPHITLTGHLTAARDVAQHLLLGDVFLLPSLWDGMPNSLLEAMAAGVPVIASDAGGIPEVVHDGVSGFLVPRTHLHRLADRIEELLSLSGAHRAALTSAARQTVLAHHSLAAEEARLAAILAELPSSRS